MADTSKNDKGRWIPLEGNPEIFNQWAQKAGLITSQARFEDVYGLDEDMLAMVPRPVKALVLLFPCDENAQAKRKEENERIAKEGQPELDSTVFWVKQTISNACGTMGLIHALANAGVSFTPTSALQQYIIQSQAKTPLERAELLATTPLFANIHTEMASGGQTAPPTDLDTDLHFTCFVEAPSASLRKEALARSEGRDVPKAEGDVDAPGGSGMRLIELDGSRDGPIDRGDCTDLLLDAANFIKSQYLSATSSVYFSVMALSTAPEGSY